MRNNYELYVVHKLVLPNNKSTMNIRHIKCKRPDYDYSRLSFHKEWKFVDCKFCLSYKKVRNERPKT